MSARRTGHGGVVSVAAQFAVDTTQQVRHGAFNCKTARIQSDSIQIARFGRHFGKRIAADDALANTKKVKFVAIGAAAAADVQRHVSLSGVQNIQNKVSVGRQVLRRISLSVDGHHEMAHVVDRRQPRHCHHILLDINAFL